MNNNNILNLPPREIIKEEQVRDTFIDSSAGIENYCCFCCDYKYEKGGGL
jgi:hypothetical protein